MYVQDTIDDEPKIFFDPNTLSDDGTITLSYGVFSRDGSIYAYALSENGSDWVTINFMNTKTGMNLMVYLFLIFSNDEKSSKIHDGFKLY